MYFSSFLFARVCVMLHTDFDILGKTGATNYVTYLINNNVLEYDDASKSARSIMR